MSEPESDFELPWRRSGDSAARTVLELSIAWSLEEPERVAEVATVPPNGAILGRGEGEPTSALPRLAFSRQRPSQTIATAPLDNSRVSREQLRFSLRGDALELESLGRCPLAVNGVPVTRAEVRAGDVLTLRNAMILLVTTRREQDLREDGFPSDFAFGTADAHGIVGETPEIWAVRRALAFAARSSEHVLLLGESGSGKELAARAIHALSPSGHLPLVARNAATLPEGLVDAELFGNAKNYPNPGLPERRGLIGEAHGSTLFLDEIGELSHAAQAHLLRVLDQHGEYQRLGDARRLSSRFRLVAATNREQQSLKHDFAARLPLRVSLPGLNERRPDIPLLIVHLLRKLCGTHGELQRFFERRAGALAEPRVDPELIELLLRHPYSTHLRELERYLLLAISTSPDDYVAATSELRAALGSSQPAPEQEPDQAALEQALTTAGGNVTRAARLLGLRNRYVLYRLMRKFGLSVGE